jgi:hypothetical protein
MHDCLRGERREQEWPLRDRAREVNAQLAIRDISQHPGPKEPSVKGRSIGSHRIASPSATGDVAEGTICQPSLGTSLPILEGEREPFSLPLGGNVETNFTREITHDSTIGHSPVTPSRAGS